MIQFVIGGSGSGKSEYAESIMDSSAEIKFYIATMKVFDEEDRKRIYRHRKMREGKGFITLEQPKDISLNGINYDRQLKSCALLECVSNLTANEMFLADGMVDGHRVVEKILKDIDALAGQVDQLVIVSNNVFEDGIDYDLSTKAYLKALGGVNAGIAGKAGQVIEVVAGIPLLQKTKKRRQYVSHSFMYNFIFDLF